MTGSAAGYSGTPLARKLRVRDGETAWRKAMPETIAEEIAASGIVQRLVAVPEPGLAFAHIFETRRSALEADLAVLRTLLAPTGMVWVSWPKKTAKVETDITEDVVRAAALPLGFVDVKVCAVDAVWSGLKLVVRKALRATR
jgi:hypothetical protein